MNWIEYLPLAEKTLSTEFHCDKRYEKILHAVMGSLTEVEELLENYDDNGNLLTDVNKQGSVAEESADIYWYLSILFRELGINTVDTTTFDETELKKKPFSALLSFTKTSLKFLDLLKKKLYYNKTIDETVMIEYSIKMFTNLNSYCMIYKTDINDILNKNIEKLKARYGEKFTSERAINRNLENERKILEGGK